MVGSGVHSKEEHEHLLHDLREIFAIYDTLHDFSPDRSSRVIKPGAQELMDAVLYFCEDTELAEITRKIMNVRLRENSGHTFRTQATFDEKKMTHNIINRSILNNIIDNEDYVYPSDKSVFQNFTTNFFKSKYIEFVPDANPLKQPILCSTDITPTIQSKTTEYHGYFDYIDGKKASYDREYKHCYHYEFQTYGITNEDKSLLSYKSVIADNIQKKVIYTHTIDDLSHEIDIDRINTYYDVPGVPDYIEFVFILSISIPY